MSSKKTKASRKTASRARWEGCSICRAIPASKHVEIMHTDERLPPEVDRLERIYGSGSPWQLRKCRQCGTFYRYEYDHDSELCGPGYTDMSIQRLTTRRALALARKILEDPPRGPQRARLAQEIAGRERRREQTKTKPVTKAALRKLAAGLGRGRGVRAAKALARIGPAAAPAVPALAEHFQRTSCREAARALGKIGAAGVPALRAGLDASSWRTRSSAAFGLGLAGPAAAAACDRLIQNLERKNARECGCKDHEFANVRSDCAWALGQLGPAAKPALPALVRSLACGWGHVVAQAREALVRLGPLALPALIKALEHREWPIRRQALKALTRMGKDAQSALPAVRAAQRANQQTPAVFNEAKRAIRALSGQ